MILASNYRNILLWRHADALPLDQNIVEDIQRPLSKKGHDQAEKMAKWLAQNMPEETMIISSPAVRTKQTAQALTNDCILLEGLSPGTSLAVVIETINDLAMNHEGKLDLLIVGHQPWLGMLATILLGTSEVSTYPESVSIKKGAVWWFKRPMNIADLPFKTLLFTNTCIIVRLIFS